MSVVELRYVDCLTEFTKFQELELEDYFDAIGICRCGGDDCFRFITTEFGNRSNVIAGQPRRDVQDGRCDEPDELEHAQVEGTELQSDEKIREADRHKETA